MAIHLLAERLTSEPPVSRGCSVIEIMAILSGAVGFWLPVGAGLGYLRDATQLGLAGGVIGVVVTMGIGPSFLQRMKRDRPHGYYQHWFSLRFEDYRLWSTPYIRRSGRWALGRRL